MNGLRSKKITLLEEKFGKWTTLRKTASGSILKQSENNLGNKPILVSKWKEIVSMMNLREICTICEDFSNC